MNVLGVILLASSTLIMSPTQLGRVDYLTVKLFEAGFTYNEASALLNNPQIAIIPKKTLPSGKINWTKVTTNLLQAESVARGHTFLAANLPALTRAEQQFGVSKEAIVGVIKVETNFGTITGNYSVWNIFYSDLVNGRTTKGWQWAATNLVALAKYCRQTQIDCFALKGSYAGAMGIPQFLPKSLVDFGYDGNGDGRVDLWNVEDAIASTANYLMKHNWAANPKKSLAAYYGSSTGYPEAVLLYAQVLRAGRLASSFGAGN